MNKLIYVLILILISSYTLGAWWDNNYLYRQSINLTNKDTTTLVDYKYKIIIKENDMSASFNWSNNGKDLRFIAPDNTTIYKYWISNWNITGKKASIYIYIPGNLTASSSKIITMYYGYASALSNTTITVLSLLNEDYESSISLDHYTDINETHGTQMWLNTTDPYSGLQSIMLKPVASTNEWYYMNNSWTNTTVGTLDLSFSGKATSATSFTGICFNFNPKTRTGYCAAYSVAASNWRSRLDYFVNGVVLNEHTDLTTGNIQNIWIKVRIKFNAVKNSWNVSYYNSANTLLKKSTTTNTYYDDVLTGGIALYSYVNLAQSLYIDDFKRNSTLSGWAYTTETVYPPPSFKFGTITIQLNNAPTAYALITPTIVYTNNTLRGYCNATDLENATVRYYYKWYVNAVLNTSGVTTYKPINTYISISNISSNKLYAGNKWSLRCIANDGVSNSTESIANKTINNNIPTITNARLSPIIAYTNNTLNGYCTGYHIDNNQSMFYDYTVYRNNINFSSGIYGNGSNISSMEKLVTTIAPANTTVGDIFILSCRMRDSFPSHSNWLNSSTLTILNSPSTIVNFGISPLYPFDNDKLYSSCNATDIDGGLSYTINWYENISWYGTSNWFNNSFLYRQLIYLTNTARNLTNYQVRIDLTNSNVGTNFNWSNNGKDIRFTTTNGGVYNYWIEKWNITGQRATIYIKINNSFNINTFKSIYMYYGYNLAISESTTNILDSLNNDFESSYILDRLSEELNGSGITKIRQQSLTVQNGTYALEVNNSVLGYRFLLLNNTWSNTTDTSTINFSISMWIHPPTPLGRAIQGYCFNFDPVTISGYCIEELNNGPNWRRTLTRFDNGIRTELFTELRSPGTNSWMKIKTIVSGVGVIRVQFYDVDGIYLPTANIDITDTTYTAGNIALVFYSISNTSSYFDSLESYSGFAYQTQIALPLTDVNIISNTLNSIYTGQNLTSNYTKVGTQYTAICNVSDGSIYTTKISNTLNISSSFNINNLEITPQYPIANINDLNCNFNVTSSLLDPINVTVSWFNSTNLNTWEHVTAYDYKYVAITNGLSYTTNIGNGSIPANDYKSYTHWKCQIGIDITNSNTIKQNSSIINVYPTENLVIYSPANNTFSTNILSTTFSVIDYDGTINCSLNVNNTFVANNASTRNGTLTTLTYTPPTNDLYRWYIYCHSNQNSQSVQSGYYNYIFDNNIPVFTNYYNSTSFLFPQIGDTVNLSVTITDNIIIDTCKLQIKDDKTGWRNESTFTINQPTYNLFTTFIIRNVSTANNSIVEWSIWCNDSTNNKVTSNINYINVTDETLPLILSSTKNIFYGTNKSIISGQLYDLYYNFTYFDYNLFQAEVNITCEKSGQIHYWKTLNITTSQFSVANSTDLDGLPMQKCIIYTSASDDHTTNIIPNYNINVITSEMNTVILDKKGQISTENNLDISKEEKYTEASIGNGIEFTTEANNNIKIVSTEDTSNIKDISINKNIDRYNMDFEFNDQKLTREFYVSSDSEIYYRLNSEYPAHFVIWNKNTKKGNWLDFDEFNSVDIKYTVEKMDDNTYHILIEPIIPEEHLNLPLQEKIDNYGIEELNFNSIGGTTITNATYEFYIGGSVNISTLNIYDNGTYVNNFTLQVTTLDSYPGFNGTFNILGNTEILENISNGSYRLDFSSNRYFSKRVYINITNISQKAVYRTFQGIVNAYARNIKTLAPVYNTNGSVTDNITGVITKQMNTDNVTEALTFYLNKSNYNIAFNATGYATFTDAFSLDYKQNLSITFNISFIITFNFIDERTLLPFNMSSPDAIRFILYCPNSTTTTLISISNLSTANLPITCNYNKFKFVLEYPATSYYRTLIYPSSLFVNQSFNITVYLIDLRTTTAVVNTLIVDDLLQQYDNPSIYVKKIIDDKTVLITSDYIDIENKVTAYLVLNHEYIIEIWSDNNPIRVVGPYSADNAGNKIIRVYDISLESNPSGLVNDVYHTIVNQTINGTKYIIAEYTDLNNETTSVTFNVFRDQYNTTLLYTDTVAGNSNIQFMYNYSLWENYTLYPEIIYNYPGRNPINVVKQINSQGFRIDLPIMQYVTEDFMGWFLTIVLSVLAIMATAKTANVMTMILLGFSALFIVFGWYPLAWGVWAVIMFIALLAMFKKQEKATS